MHVFNVEQVDALLESAIQNNKATIFTVYIFRTRIINIQNFLLQLVFKRAVPDGR